MSLQDRLKGLLDDRRTYEAQQLATTLFKRQVKQPEKAPEARAMAVATCESLALLGDAAAAAALAGELVQHLRKDAVPCDAVVSGLLQRLLAALPSGRAMDELADSVAKYAPASRGPVVVREYLARRLFGRAQLHALKLSDRLLQRHALETGTSEWAFAVATEPDERDLIVVRCVLECLARGLTETAEVVLATCMQRWHGEPTPLLNCAAATIQIVKERRPEGRDCLFELYALYTPSLERDPALPHLYVALAKKCYNDKPEGGGGGLMSMLSGLLGSQSGGGSAAFDAASVMEIDD
jgi:hypothetical protein